MKTLILVVMLMPFLLALLNTGSRAVVLYSVAYLFFAVDNAFAQNTCPTVFYEGANPVLDGNILALRQRPDPNVHPQVKPPVRRFPAKNYQHPDQSPLPEVSRDTLSRDAGTQAAINRAITNDLAKYGFTFKKKGKEKGEGGTIEFTPQVSAEALTLSKRYFDQLVQSTGPVLRSLRHLLQRVFTSGDLFIRYSEAAPGNEKDRVFRELVVHLELDRQVTAMTELVQKELIDVIAESIYFEKRLIGDKMKDYPFLPMVGFDAAITNLKQIVSIFYEYNSGTPSGLTNNTVLIERLRILDPERYKQLVKHMVGDETFKILRDTMYANARKWTGVKDPSAIVVTVGPGSFNGANPDVHGVAEFSGMPLVRTKDLYTHLDGSLRLNTGVGKKHPRVIGVYNRVEEAALLRSEIEGVPWVRPENKGNDAIGRKIGAVLKPGVEYKWIRDPRTGEIVDVVKDRNGEPVVENYVDTEIGRDPVRPDVAPPKTFFAHITEGSLYLSGLGGRVVDDKRIFEIASRHLSQRFDQRRSQVAVAQPPHTLTRESVNEFYSNPRKYVVKVPDESGGIGVYILPLESESVVARVVEMVREDLRRDVPQLRIQEFTTAAVISTAQLAGNRYSYVTRVPDWRIFVMMDENGVVRAGANSFLVRVADRYSASTNTSQGAGYGIGVLANDDGSPPLNPDPTASALPSRPTTSMPLGVSYVDDIKQYFNLYRRVLTLAAERQDQELRKVADGTENPFDLDNLNQNLKWSLLEILIQRHKELISIFGMNFSPIMDVLKKFQAGKIGSLELYKQLTAYKDEFLKSNFPYNSVRKEVLYGLDWATPAVKPRAQTKATANLTPTREQLENLCNIDWYKPGSSTHRAPIFVRIEKWLNTDVGIFEMGRVTQCHDTNIQRLITKLERRGGRLAIVRAAKLAPSLVVAPGELLFDPPSAETEYTSVAGPRGVQTVIVVSIDFGQAQSLAALAHEEVHVDNIIALEDEFRSAGLRDSELFRRVKAIREEPTYHVRDESQALRRELETEFQETSPFNSVPVETLRRPREPHEVGYARRMAYPQMTGVVRNVAKVRWRSANISDHDLGKLYAECLAEAGTWLEEAILIAVSSRQKRLEHLQESLNRVVASIDPEVVELHRSLKSQISALKTTKIFELLVNQEDAKRFSGDKTLMFLHEVFKRKLKEMGRRRLVEFGRGFPPLNVELELPAYFHNI